MTTIAFDGKTMACDSCWANFGTQTTSMTKIERLASGALLGGAGDSDIRSLIALIDKIKTPDKLPSRHDLSALKSDFHVLLAFPRGQVVHIASGGEEGRYDAQIWPANRGIAAAGSGADVALGAMAAGKTAREAVAIACRFDINSRLPVHTMALAK